MTSRLLKKLYEARLYHECHSEAPAEESHAANVCTGFGAQRGMTAGKIYASNGDAVYRTQRGFTLVDLVIGIAACGIIAFVGVFLVMPADNWVFIIEQRSGITDARVALVRMIRETGSVKSPGGITSFTPTRFAFANIGDEAVSFEKTGTDLLRNGTDVLARKVQSLLFEYLADDGTAAILAADIRVVRMTITLTAGNHLIRLQSAAQLKNGVPQ